MAATIASYSVTSAWSATNRVAIGADSTSVKITATGPFRVVYAVTDSTTQPAVDPGVAHSIKSGESEELSLNNGEYLWVAARAKASRATVSTLT